MGASLAQRAVDERRQCYHEALVRNAHLRHSNWIREQGWRPEDEARYYTITTACEVLRYRRPVVANCDALRAGARPILPLNKDDNVYVPLARLELAARFPERASELFPWRKESQSPSRYWRRAIGDLHELELLKDNSDFGLNVLIRLLYLHGHVPSSVRAPWRTAPERSANFDAAAQRQIERALLTYKYWHDEPFRAVNERALRVARRDRHVRDMEAENAKKVAQGKKPDAIEDKDRDADGDKFKYEMQYWSENHQILFATAEYLAGQWLPGERFEPGKRFREPGKRYNDPTGRDRMKRARARLDIWLDDRLRFGQSEWNAPGYYDEHGIALMNLADFAIDDSVRIRACMVLDLIVFDLARFTQDGSFAVTAGRSHFKHKNNGWHQSPGDLVQILFGTRNGVVVNRDALSACAFASARRYEAPDALLDIGRARPVRSIDRTRVSIDWSEAGEYGIGFESETDVMRWWSRASWFTKHVINATRQLVKKYGLDGTSPFKDLLPKTGTAADLLSVTKVGAYVAAGPAFPLLIPLLGDPLDQEDEVANALSIVTEGSAYTRGDLYTYRTRHAMLSSTQNHHAGQLSFQGQSCQATLNMCATVFTTHPSAGGGIDESVTDTALTVGGALVGSVLGPLGTIAGGILGSKANVGGLELLPADSDGPDWWTGSVTQPRVVQVKGAAILGYKPKAFQILLFGHRFHAWFPQDAFDDLPAGIKGEPSHSIGERAARSAQYFPFRKPRSCNVDTGRWLFGRSGDGYVALFSGQLPEWTHDGDWACKEVMVNAQRNVFIIQIGDADQFSSYQKFIERVLAARVHINGLNWKLSDFQCSYDVPNGSRLELHYDDDEVRYAGVPLSDNHFPRNASTYAQIAWGQQKYAIQHGGKSVTHDVKRRRRTMGGSVSELRHETNLRVYAQNMGLFKTIAPYAGTERDAAIATLIAVLLADPFDVVGLSEMWEDEDVEHIVRAVGSVYKYHRRGPEEIDALQVAAAGAGAAVGAAAAAAAGVPAIGGVVVGAVLGGGATLGSGLFLLSRHPIVAANGTRYRQCSGEDCASDKGAMHVRIHPEGWPCDLDVFLSHTQNLTPLIGKKAAARSALAAQVRHLAAFVASCRDSRGPALLIGDLNVDALDPSDPGLYAHLVEQLGAHEDLKPTFTPPDGSAPPLHPDATSEQTDSGVSSFNEGSAQRPVIDARRFRDAAQRLDYLFVWNGALCSAEWTDRNVVIYQSSPGRDMSDHYGVHARLATITQKLPAPGTAIQSVTLHLSRLWCLQTTSGPGDDEVRITLRAIDANGGEQTAGTRPMDVGEGDSRELADWRIVFADPGEFLIVAVSGVEIDDLSGDDDLGASSTWLWRNELAAIKGVPTRYVLSRLMGDGGEYAVEIIVSVE